MSHRFFGIILTIAIALAGHPVVLSQERTESDNPAVESPKAGDAEAEGKKESGPRNASEAGVPEVVHPKAGETASLGSGRSITLVGKLQNYKGGADRDPDVLSPKSVNIHPSGKKFYVNSLEGGKTVVYSLPELKKLKVIRHSFNSSHSSLWAPPSGLFRFRHYKENVNNFTGKPVESAFSHDGRYLWVPYYRRSYDLNAQDPSALSVIDCEGDTIVRIMEAGVLPKMVTVSPDGNKVAISHWGDNTVGIIDISSGKPTDWKYIANIAVGRQLIHNFSLTESVDRDKNSGEALRGSVFTPDGRYLLVGCMSGGGIAVIDVEKKKYLGKLLGMMPNVRHLVVHGDWLYASINVAGYVERCRLGEIMKAIGKMDGSGNATTGGWEKAKVSAGARTIELSPEGDYIFAACNFGSAICVVDSGMRRIADIPADSYPVGLDISPDGKWLISTSQGRKGFGGNCVDIFALKGFEKRPETAAPLHDTTAISDSLAVGDDTTAGAASPQNGGKTAIIAATIIAIATIAMAISIPAIRRRRLRTKK